MRRFTRIKPLWILLVAWGLATAAPGKQRDGSGPPANPPSPEEIVPPTPAEEELPPLEEELWLHGGSYLYAAEGDGHPQQGHGHWLRLRLPEWWREPQPFTLGPEFLGTGPIRSRTHLKWPGKTGYHWEPRFVGYGAYQVFGLAFEDGDVRTDGMGHQLLCDLDLRLTGTERFHMQFRPLGRENTGGSLYRFSDPVGYDDNSTLIPDRWWFEGEWFSMFQGLFPNPFVPRDYNLVIGKFPFALHNNLLINDDVTGLIVSKNTILLPPFSNMNVQAFYLLDDVDALPGVTADLFGTHASADLMRVFWEATYAYVSPNAVGRDANYAAASGTKFFGPLSLAGRALFKWGDGGGRGDGQLFVLESNYTRVFDHGLWHSCGIEKGVFYCNAFRSTQGWNSISGGNFDRIRSAFAANPLVQISRGFDPQDSVGATLGAQFFRHHEDEAIIPEFSYEAPGGDAAFGLGLWWWRKVGPRTYVEIRGVKIFSGQPDLRREGIFAASTILF